MNRIKFETELRNAYSKLFKTDVYKIVASENTPEELAIKMTIGILEKSASIDGNGVSMACKACGIKKTYKSIITYCLGE